jgi:hypothetical protein
MNAAALELPPALQNLIDSRLDAIERALLQGNTPRAERRSILEDIETQILEMLSAEALGHEPTRADLLRVFSRLDPPEAFAGEPIESVRHSSRPGRPGTAGMPGPSDALPLTKPRYTTTGILACVGGLAALVLGLPLCAFSMIFSESELLISFAVAVVAVTGIPALVLGILYAVAIHQSQGRLRGLTCAALGISALPINVASILLGFLIAALKSEVVIIGGTVIICILAVVGVIHLTYRSLELLVNTGRRTT